MTVFLTGATGFVGSHVARVLEEQQIQLRLLARPTSDLAAVQGLSNADVIRGDLAQPESLRSALQGCDALIHVAADYRLWVRDPAAMYRANVEGTRALLRLAS